MIIRETPKSFGVIHRCTRRTGGLWAGSGFIFLPLYNITTTGPLYSTFEDACIRFNQTLRRIALFPRSANTDGVLYPRNATSEPSQQNQALPSLPDCPALCGPFLSHRNSLLVLPTTVKFNYLLIDFAIALCCLMQNPTPVSGDELHASPG